MQSTGISSESIWTVFDSVATSSVRQVKGQVFIAWTRIADTDSYATIGTSVIGGTHVLKGVGDITINEADAFSYFDESSRIIRLEYERHLLEPLGGMSFAIADLVLDNTDLRLTPDYDSTIGTALRPNRPIKVFVGFRVAGQDKLLPILEGLTLEPKENKMSRTVTLSSFDYLKWLNEKPQETAVYQDQRSDQIIADILSRAGVGSSNYILDTGLNTIGFAWFQKGQTAGERIRQICEAEEAIFFQDEFGTLRFENRDKYSASPYDAVAWTIEPDDILQWEGDSSSRVINRVIVKSKPRSAKAETEVWRAGAEIEVDGLSSTTIWATFEDPVSSFTTPVATTDYKAWTATGGGGSDITADISFTLTSFTKDAKLVITNANAGTAYINFLRIRGTPVTVDEEIKEVFWDEESITDYNEQEITIENDFIDNQTWAASLAQKIVRRHKRPNQIIVLTVRGIPQLQLRDRIKVKDQDLNAYTEYRLIAIQGVLDAGGFVQKLKLRKITSLEAN